MSLQIIDYQRFKLGGILSVGHFSDIEIAPSLLESEFEVFKESEILHEKSGFFITPYDSRTESLTSNVELIGYFQSFRYLPDKNFLVHNLQVGSEPFFDGCTISIRGGEYKGNQKLLLGKRFYEMAIAEVRERFGDVEFRIVTDDRGFASSILPGIPVHSSGGVKRIPYLPYLHPRKRALAKDFSMLQNSRLLILSNSSFAWWGAYSSNKAEFVLAPKYWAAHNISDGYWSLGGSLTPGWFWMDREGRVASYEDCLLESESKGQANDRD